jgi:hypothetical protein
MSINAYESAFLKILREEPEVSPEEISDREAMAQTLDDGTSPEDFDVEGADTAQKHIEATTQMQQKMVGELQSWIGELEKFSKFLNDPSNPSSMQSRLRNAVPDTIFDKIRVAENKKIARVSMEVTSLNEMLKGYLSSSQDPKFKGV